MVSYYLSIHFMALNAILKKIIGGGGGGGGVHMNFKLSGWYEKIAHKSVIFHRIAPKI